MPDTVKLRRPLAPGDTVMLDGRTAALVLHLRPTEPAAEYYVAATTVARDNQGENAATIKVRKRQ